MPIIGTADVAPWLEFAANMPSLDTEALTLPTGQMLQVSHEVDDAVMAEPLPLTTDQARHSNPAAKRLNSR